MNAISMIDAIQEVNSDFEVVIADTPDLIRRCYELRHQVYVAERSFLDGEDGLEFDEFDGRCYHVALVVRTTGDVVGTVRLVLSCPLAPGAYFPMQLVCPPGILDGLPLNAMVEISRFAISKERRSLTAGRMMRIALMQGIVTITRNLGITHWCAIMERTMLRLLAASGIKFIPIGEPVEYHGLRQPCFNKVADLLDGILADEPDLWGYITKDGANLPAEARCNPVIGCIVCPGVCREDGMAASAASQALCPNHGA